MGLRETGRPGKGVKNEAEAATGVLKVDSWGTARDNSAAVGATGGQEFGEQAGGNAPRRIGSARRSGSQETVKGHVRSGAGSGGCFSDQASQGSQVEPDVGLKGERLASEVAVDG